MIRKKEGVFTSLLALVMYVVMVGMNALANILPINGITTGEVSDSLSNLFAPAGITFSIWGVIYILLGIYSIYQIIYINRRYMENISLKRVNLFYIISSVANSLWIYNWHYGNLGITVVLMLVILVSLIVIVLTLRSIATPGDRMLWARLPFSIYFGWITVATIANITAFLVDIGWSGFGISEPVWTIMVLIVGLLVGGTTIWRLNDKAYGAVMVWAYMGILFKHISSDGFNGQYPEIIVTAGVAIGIFLSVIFLTFKRKKFMFN
ncbi:MAG: tryptophan-rich sensory protein [Bacillota bacterium]